MAVSGAQQTMVILRDRLEDGEQVRSSDPVWVAVAISVQRSVGDGKSGDRDALVARPGVGKQKSAAGGAEVLTWL